MLGIMNERALPPQQLPTAASSTASRWRSGRVRRVTGDLLAKSTPLRRRMTTWGRNRTAHRGRRLALACLVAILGVPVSCLSDIGSTTQTLSAQIYPTGTVSVNSGASLLTTGTTFQAFSGSLPVNFRVRTTPTGGGSITVQATSDFSPAGGPSISKGMLAYTCSGASLGTSCSGSQTVSTTTQTPVATLPGGVCTGGGGACSSSDPNSVILNLALPNNPQFKTGTYTASITLTISAT